MKNKLAYFVSKSSMFGIGFFLLIKDNGKNSWISLLLGTLWGLIIIYFYSKLKSLFKNKSLSKVFSETKIGSFYRIIFIFICIFMISAIFTLLTMFINAFYLINTPKIIILIPFLIISYYLCIKEKNVLSNLSVLLFYFSITTVLLFALPLMKYMNFSNLYPLFNYNNINIIKGSIIYASVTAIPEILAIDYYNRFNNITKDYLIASILNFIILLSTIVCLGEPLINIYIFPEYSNLKQIKILDFIENIENLSAFGWYSEMFMMLSLLITNLKDNLPKKYNKVSLLTILILTLIITTYFISISYNYILLFYNCYYKVLILFLLLLVVYFIYLKIQNVNKK